MPLEERRDGGLPAPSAELVLLRTFLEAHLATIPPKQAKRFMKRSEELMELFEAGSEVLPMRAGREALQVRDARKAAAAWFRRVSGAVVDRL